MNDLTRRGFIETIGALFGAGTLSAMPELNDLNTAIITKSMNTRPSQRDCDKTLIEIFDRIMCAITNKRALKKISNDDAHGLQVMLYKQVFSPSYICAILRFGVGTYNVTKGINLPQNIVNWCDTWKQEIYMPDGSAVPGFDDDETLFMMIEETVGDSTIIRQKMHAKMLELTGII